MCRLILLSLLLLLLLLIWILIYVVFSSLVAQTVFIYSSNNNAYSSIKNYLFFGFQLSYLNCGSDVVYLYI